MGSKQMNDMQSVYVNSLPCVRVKGCESECFRIDSGLRKVCIMSPWLFNVYMDAVMKELKGGWGRGVRFREDGRDYRLSDLLYADD